MLLSLSHWFFDGEDNDAIARSATATEFIGTERVRDQATTVRSQASEEDNVTGAVEEDTQSAGWAFKSAIILMQYNSTHHRFRIMKHPTIGRSIKERLCEGHPATPLESTKNRNLRKLRSVSRQPIKVSDGIHNNI